jgi:hypothetical protein
MARESVGYLGSILGVRSVTDAIGTWTWRALAAAVHTGVQ